MSHRKEKENMFSNLSDKVVRYILNEIPPYVGLLVMETDQDGVLLSWMGPWERYLKKSPEKGKLLDDQTPFLFGMLPPLINPMIISHVRVKDHVYAEIHIMMDEHEKIWVFIIDQSRQVEIIHPIVQLFNQERLSIRQDKKHSSAKGTLSALYLLDYLSFEKVSDGFNLLGIAPEWFHQTAKQFVMKGKLIELYETFPYLEVFEIEAKEVWQAKKDGKVISGIWEETSKKTERLYLHALALRHEQRNYLLIKPVSEENNLNESFIQKAREQRLTLDQLAATEKKLKQLLGFKDQFVSIISHDLRSPIGAVISLSDMLIRDIALIESLTENQKELLMDIKSEMIRLLDYNDKLYQWSNLELGNFKIVKKQIRPFDLFQYIEKMQWKNLHAKNISLLFNADKKMLVEADETLLGQALNNLVGNSVKFTPEGGKISLEFHTDIIGSYIQVKDSGVGMDQETINRLFSGFTRKSTMGTYGEKGTGLGLGIVKKIVDAHGFQIQVHSEAGAGSAFVIRM